MVILCLDIIEYRERGDVDADQALVAWVGDFVERKAEERVELGPAVAVIRALTLACREVKSSGH